MVINFRVFVVRVFMIMFSAPYPCISFVVLFVLITIIVFAVLPAFPILVGRQLVRAGT